MFKRNLKGQFTHENKSMLGKKPPQRAWDNSGSKSTRFQKGHKINIGHIPWNKGKDFGGTDIIKRKVMGLSLYKKWRDEIKTRDGNKCTRCSLPGKLEVDHYPIPFANIIKSNKITTVMEIKDCKELWDKTNARTLCKECHKQVTYWQQATRDSRKVFMDTLIELAEKDDKIILIIPDVGYSYMEEFAKRFPNRFYNFGVTEQSTIMIAVGLALSGFKPYVYSMINFVLFRPYEMVRNGIVHHKANIKLLGVKGSSGYKFLGFSHNMTDDKEDIRTCENLNLKYYIPQNNEEVRQTILTSYNDKIACYIRL